MSRKLCVTICRALASPYSGPFRLRTPLAPVARTYYHSIQNDRSSRRRPPKKHRPSASTAPAKTKNEQPRQRQRQPGELTRTVRRVSSAAVHAQPDLDLPSAEEQSLCCASPTADVETCPAASCTEVGEFKEHAKTRIPCTCIVSAADAKSQQQVVTAAAAPPSSVRRMIFCTCCASLATDSQRDPDLNDGRIVPYTAAGVQGSHSQLSPFKGGRGIFCCASPATHSQRAPKDESIFCYSYSEGDELALSKLSGSLSILSCKDPALDALSSCESGRVNGCLSLSRASSSSKTTKDCFEKKGGGAALSKSGLSAVENSQAKPFKRRQLLFRLCRRQQVLPWKNTTTRKDEGSRSLRRKSTISNIAPPLNLLLRNKVL